MNEEEFIRKVLELVSYDVNVLEQRINSFNEQTDSQSVSDD